MKTKKSKREEVISFLDVNWDKIKKEPLIQIMALQHLNKMFLLVNSNF